MNYVTTDGNGEFTISDNYSCTPGTLLYAVLTGGGPPGSASSNKAVMLLSAIGDCAQLGSARAVVINALTTVAGVAALQQFVALDPSSGVPLIGTSAANVTGLANAFALASTLASPFTGAVAASTSDRTLPTAKLNTLADLLASCADSTAPGFSDCLASLGRAAAPGGVAASNTLQEALFVLQNPGMQPANLVSGLLAQSPFQPMLTAPPNDWTLPVTLTGGNLVQPGNLVIDGSGNAVVFNCAVSCVASATAPDNIVEFSPTGSVLTPQGGLAGPAIHNVSGMAIDTQSTLWTANDGATATGNGNTADSIGKIPLGNPDSASTFPTSAPPTSFPVAELANPFGLVLDPVGNLYISNPHNGFVEYIFNQTIWIAGNTLVNGPSSAPYGIALRPILDPGGTGELFVASPGHILRFNARELSDVGPGALEYAGEFNYGDVNAPVAVAIGASGWVWYVNSGSSTVAALDNNENRIGDPISSEAFGSLAGLAIDGNGHTWVPSCNSSCPGNITGNQHFDALVEIGLAPGGTGLAVLTPEYGYQPAGLSHPAAIAIDGSGNIWITNAGQPSVTLLVGAAAPVQTPVQAAFMKKNFGQKP